MQDKIKDLAYRLWQEAGSPQGRDLEHWLAAEARLKAPAKPKAPKPAKPKADSPKTQARPKTAKKAKP